MARTTCGICGKDLVADAPVCRFCGGSPGAAREDKVTGPAPSARTPYPRFVKYLPVLGLIALGLKALVNDHPAMVAKPLDHPHPHQALPSRLSTIPKELPPPTAEQRATLERYVLLLPKIADDPDRADIQLVTEACAQVIPGDLTSFTRLEAVIGGLERKWGQIQPNCPLTSEIIAEVLAEIRTGRDTALQSDFLERLAVGRDAWIAAMTDAMILRTCTPLSHRSAFAPVATLWPHVYHLPSYFHLGFVDILSPLPSDLDHAIAVRAKPNLTLVQLPAPAGQDPPVIIANLDLSVPYIGTEKADLVAMIAAQAAGSMSLEDMMLRQRRISGRALLTFMSGLDQLAAHAPDQATALGTHLAATGIDAAAFAAAMKALVDDPSVLQIDRRQKAATEMVQYETHFLNRYLSIIAAVPLFSLEAQEAITISLLVY